MTRLPRDTYSITLGKQECQIRMDLYVLAELEESFGVDSFEEILPLLSRQLPTKYQIIFYPCVRNLLTFWQVILRNQLSGTKPLDHQSNMSPHKLLAAALNLFEQLNESWFDDPKKEDSAPAIINQVVA